MDGDSVVGRGRHFDGGVGFSEESRDGRRISVEG